MGNKNMKNNNPKDLADSSPQSVHEEAMRCLKEALTRCLQMIKISHYKKLSERAFQYIGNASSDQIKTYGNWILCLDAIADSCLAIKQILSQSETYDFLTVAVATNIEEKIRTKTIDDIIFRIYRDIMANYESSDEKLRISYPKIIVDVVSILAKGVNIEGKKIAPYQVEIYYQRRKTNVGTSIAAQPVTPPTSTSATAASIVTIEKKKNEEPQDNSLPKLKPTDNYEHLNQVNEEDKEKIIESLSKITSRNKKELESSLTKLQRIDIIRLRHLCENYGKLQKYCEIIHGSEEKFKAELQKDIGRKLSHHQLQRAANSIKQAKMYIENVLDGKFEPHGSYGINHVKHNLEYGYQLTGLIQSKRRSSTHKR
jgi:hypothetical protein